MERKMDVYGFVDLFYCRLDAHTSQIYIVEENTNVIISEPLLSSDRLKFITILISSY